MIQQILVGIVFLVSVYYMIRLILKTFSPSKTGCTKGCGCEVGEKTNQILKNKIIKTEQ